MLKLLIAEPNPSSNWTLPSKTLAGGPRMDSLSTLLDDLKKSEHPQGNLLGFLHLLIGRTISRNQIIVSKGISWRDLSILLKKVRWDPDAVRELGLDPKELPPRDRQRYWYTAIMQAKVDSPEAIAAGERFADELRKLGYDVA